MNNLDKQYTDLLQHILDNGVRKSDRTGTGTLSVFGKQITHKMSEGFPLLTTKKMHWKSIVVELLWFLRGDTNIKYLVDNDCHIWDGDAYKNYCKSFEPTDSPYDFRIKGLFGEPLSKEEFINKIKTDDEFARKWGELGPIYGKQWRTWKKWSGKEVMQDFYEAYIDEIDQIADLISKIKKDPDSRRLMVNAWNVGELDQMTLPPCHYGFQVYTRELSHQERYNIHKKYITKDKLDLVWEIATAENLDKLGVPKRAISLMYNSRSQDVPLGTPFNIASYALLLEIIAKMTNMVPDELIANMGDCHIYLNQIDGVKEQLTRESYQLPKLVISNQVNFNEGIDEFLNSCLVSDFQIEGYRSHAAIKMPLSN